MKIPYYQVNAFIGGGFKGNPAGVCLVNDWPDKATMQAIAYENNLAETAFIVERKSYYDIRWFTPRVEVDLCGHATLASAFVLLNLVKKSLSEVNFKSRSGMLTVQKENEYFVLNFPSDELIETEILTVFNEALLVSPLKAFRGKTDYMLVFQNESEIREMKPHLDIISSLPARGLIVTAPGEEVDFVSRFFAPQSGIPEDPVTGSAHTTLTQYWVQKLNKNPLKAWQLSERGGELYCKLLDNRVEIGGKAQLHISGVIST
jgi:PhzF family phenazine biosynthesis protein